MVNAASPQRGLEVWYREKNKALQVLMPTNTQRADVLYSCFPCVMGTALCWKLSLPAQLQEQFCVRGVHSPSAVPALATAVARSLLVFHAVSSDLIRIGLRPPTPLTRVTDQQSFIFISSYYFPISSVLRIPPRNQTDTAFSTFWWSYFWFSLWNNTEPRTLLSDPCLDSKLYKTNMFSFSCTLSFPSLFWGLCIEVKDWGPPTCWRAECCSDSATAGSSAPQEPLNHSHLALIHDSKQSAVFASSASSFFSQDTE